MSIQKTQARKSFYSSVSSCRLGAHYRTSTVGTEQDMEVERIISHQSYNRPYHLANDIAMLKLRKPALLNQAVDQVEKLQMARCVGLQVK